MRDFDNNPGPAANSNGDEDKGIVNIVLIFIAIAAIALWGLYEWLMFIGHGGIK